MSEWPKYNPERHYPAFGDNTNLCEECEDVLCLETRPCRCCLATEVVALRTQHDEIVARLTDDLEKATRTIQRVRDRATQMACTRIECDILSCVAYRDILRALDGGDE